MCSTGLPLPSCGQSHYCSCFEKLESYCVVHSMTPFECSHRHAVYMGLTKPLRDGSTVFQ